MAATTFEEAKLCPKCSLPGEDRAVKAGPHGSKVHTIYCVTKLCPWYDTPWMVQVNADGSIPPPQDHRGKPKVYEGFEGHDEMAKNIIDNLNAQYVAEQRPGYEVRNPRSGL